MKSQIIKMKKDEEVVNINILESPPIKETFFSKMNPFKKRNFDGHLLYEYAEGRYKLIDVTGFKDIEKINKKAYILNRIMGTLNNKPFFMIKNNIPISVNAGTKSSLPELENGIDLCYDSGGFYTYLDYATAKNLQAKGGEQLSFFEFLQKNWIIILIILVILIGAMLFLFFTPQGLVMLDKIFPQQ